MGEEILESSMREEVWVSSMGPYVRAVCGSTGEQYEGEVCKGDGGGGGIYHPAQHGRAGGGGQHVQQSSNRFTLQVQ